MKDQEILGALGRNVEWTARGPTKSGPIVGFVSGQRSLHNAVACASDGTARAREIKSSECSAAGRCFVRADQGSRAPFWYALSIRLTADLLADQR